MRILTIAYYTLLKNFRDRKSLSLTMLFPILLILILGTALSKVYAPNALPETKVVLVNEDQGNLAQRFEQYLATDDIKQLLDVSKIQSYSEGKKAVEDEKANALLYIPAGYTSSAMSGGKAVIEVYQRSNDALKQSIVKNIVDGFVNAANTMSTISAMGASIQDYKVYQSIDQTPVKSTGATPRAIDYYAVTMLALMLMYGALYASFGMAEDKTEKTWIRIKSAPIRPFENYLGKVLGTIGTLVLQAAILILFTKLAYHSNWGSNIGMILLFSILFSMCTTALGIMAYVLVNDAIKASGIINVLVVFFTFISGGYAKISADGTWFDKLSYLSPNKLFQTAVFNTVYGGPAGQVGLCMLALVLMTIVMFAIATLLGRRELA